MRMKSLRDQSATGGLELIVDGRIYKTQQYGGVSRIFTEILPRLCHLEPSSKVAILLHSGTSQTHLPHHPRIVYRNIPEIRFPRYSLLRPWVIRSMLGRGRGKIWLSTYYTSPKAWSGRQVVFVYDFIHEKYKDTYWQDGLQEADTVIFNKSLAIQNADLVLCISETTRQDLVQLYHVPVEKTAVVHLAHQPGFMAMDVAPPEKDFILYVGKRSKYKSFATLLSAFSQWERRTDFLLVCVGGGEWWEDEQKYLSAHGLNDQVVLLNSVDEKRLSLLYNQASAFVYPSEYEGFGIPLLEAMACGCPVVASRIPSSLEIAHDVPFYFEAANPNDLIHALNQALDKNKASIHKQAGIELASTYSWDKAAGEFLQAILRLS